MKKSKLQELHGILDNIAVLQHFIDSESGSLFIGMKGVENQIGIQKELDLKVRILLGVQIEKMEEQLKEAGIDMTPEKKEPEKKEPETPPETPPEKVIDATASESGEEGAGATGPEEGAGADEENPPE